MIKTLLILLMSFFSFQGFAQDPDPELFKTWYLYFVQDTDLGVPYYVSEIDPPIQPYITIFEDLSFNGEGACNTFNGNYEHSGTNNISAITFNNTTNDCGIQVHNNFEGDYFLFMQEFWYDITIENDGLKLSLHNILMGHATFKDYPLSTSDYNLNTIKLYPNPVSNTLYISLDKTIIKKMVVFSISGKIILEQHVFQNNSIDVSSLSKGMYFIEISSVSGKSVKKFMKN